ncbi:2OG-Fe(II) oxygenase [Paraburkholderia sp. J67]|uniref:HalD/BesD family halogenase n=1 Tax=Paraburkholderia sp. J67 TaxID=2805435 RepID=UPI002ABD4CE1|nr:2OG-Fe(II) oxygenase [Paraburkholderia sp. J67]
MENIIDLNRYPLNREGSKEWDALVAWASDELKRDGMFNLEGFIRPEALKQAVNEILPVVKDNSHTHKRVHNIYFRPEIPELPRDHPALRTVETINHTVCADQIAESLITSVYEYEPLVTFIAATMHKQKLYVMEDPLAKINILAYREGEALNWHFDRSEFTTTLLLQEPKQGGEFEYRNNLRSDSDPNYDGVAALLEGRDANVQKMSLKSGTLNVFRGKNTAHRVSRVVGEKDRMVAVFSYYERPGVVFREEERVGFYGRAH